MILVGTQVFYTNMILPDEVWCQSNARGDHQIGCQEMVAVLLFQWSFAFELRGAGCFFFVDNRGVLGRMLKGAFKAPEVDLMVSRMWMQCEKEKTSLHAWYVQSGANSGWAVAVVLSSHAMVESCVAFTRIALMACESMAADGFQKVAVAPYWPLFLCEPQCGRF